jgi:fluoroquinolone resistance protein
MFEAATLLLRRQQKKHRVRRTPPPRIHPRNDRRSMNPAELKKRWDSPEAKEFTALLRQNGRSGNGFDVVESPFGTMASTGLLDLRYLSLSDQTELRKIVFRNADLSVVQFNGAWIERCTFENIRSDGGAWKNVAEHGNTFMDCTFIKTDFRDAILGYKGSQFHRCKFADANFQRSQFIRPEFNDCVFKDCHFGNVDFNASSFERCEFSGEVRSVWFRGGFALPSQSERFGTPRPNRMLNVSFAHATLVDVTFSNHCDLSSVVPPSDSDHRLFRDWKSCLLKLQSTVQSWPNDERMAGELFCKTHLTHAQAQESYILSFIDLMEVYGTVAPKIWDSLGTCLSSR